MRKHGSCCVPLCTNNFTNQYQAGNTKYSPGICTFGSTVHSSGIARGKLAPAFDLFAFHYFEYIDTFSYLNLTVNITGGSKFHPVCFNARPPKKSHQRSRDVCRSQAIPVTLFQLQSELWARFCNVENVKVVENTVLRLLLK